MSVTMKTTYSTHASYGNNVLPMQTLRQSRSKGKKAV